MTDSFYDYGPNTQQLFSYSLGGTVLTPGMSAGNTLIYRSLKFTNTSLRRDAWVYVGLNEQFVDGSSYLINDLLVPAGQTVIVPFDFVQNEDDLLAAYAITDQTYSNMQVQSAVTLLNSATDSTNYTTGAYTMTNGEIYIMTMSVKGGNGVSSITGTHTSEPTWNLVQQGFVVSGGYDMRQYACAATATSSGSNTVTFSGTNTSILLSIVKLVGANTGPAGSSEFNYIRPAGFRGYAIGSTAWARIDGSTMCGGRLFTGYAQESNGINWSPGPEFTEIHDGEVSLETHAFTACYSLRPGRTGEALRGNYPNGTAAANDRFGMLLDIHDNDAPVYVTADGVLVT